MRVLSIRNARRARQRGQGMTEYIIITALIAIAAIAAVAFFGGTVRAQVGGMAKELSGQDGTQSIQRAGNQANSAANQGTTARKLNNYSTTKDIN
jgi:pilus assembly protein Flp/PilA